MAKNKRVAPSKTLPNYTQRGRVKLEPFTWLQLLPMIIAVLFLIYMACVGHDDFVWRDFVPKRTRPVVVSLDRSFRELFPQGTGHKSIDSLLNPTPLRNQQRFSSKEQAEAMKILEANRTLQDALLEAMEKMEIPGGIPEAGGGGRDDTMKRIKEKIANMAKTRDASEQLKEVDDHIYAEDDAAAQASEQSEQQAGRQLTEEQRVQGSQAFREADEELDGMLDGIVELRTAMSMLNPEVKGWSKAKLSPLMANYGDGYDQMNLTSFTNLLGDQKDSFYVGDSQEVEIPSSEDPQEVEIPYSEL